MVEAQKYHFALFIYFDNFFSQVTDVQGSWEGGGGGDADAPIAPPPYGPGGYLLKVSNKDLVFCSDVLMNNKS